MKKMKMILILTILFFMKICYNKTIDIGGKYENKTKETILFKYK